MDMYRVNICYYLELVFVVNYCRDGVGNRFNIIFFFLNNIVIKWLLLFGSETFK